MFTWINETFLVSCAFVALLVMGGRRAWSSLIAWLDQQSLRIKHDIDEAAIKRDSAEYFFRQQEKEQEAFDQRLKETHQLAESSIQTMRQQAEERLAFLVTKHQQQWEHKIAHQQHEAEHACYRHAVDWAFAALRLLIEKNPVSAKMETDARQRVVGAIAEHWGGGSSLVSQGTHD